MYQITTFSTPASIIVDDTPITPVKPLYEVGSTAFWKDDTGRWHTVEIINCSPRGFGFACIKWQEIGWGWHTASVPFASLCDLDTYIEQDEDYGTFEAADGWDYPDTGEDADYDSDKDDRAERAALHRLGNGG